MNQFLSKVNRFVIALIGVLVLGISSVYAGTAYTNGRAFLKQGSPTGGGKVYVASNATEPTSGQYKAVTSSTSPAFNVQVAGDATFHYWAVANPGYIFTGWYTAEGALQSSGAAHISKKVTAGQAGGSDTHAYADFYASFIKQIQLSFVVPTNGSFTITHKGSEVTPAYSSFTTEGKVVLTALPADGYKLRGWYTTTNGGVTKNYFAFGNSCEPNFTSNTTIGAEFVPDDGKATFWIKGTNFIYDNLTDANTKAASVSSKMIVVVSDGIVVAGTYTISSGVTLLIPYEETYNLMTKPNIKHIPSPNAASKVTSIFRKLTLASGATINVSGNICIGGSIASCNGGSPSSFPTGSVGMLDLSRGGVINLASGSNLYAWGYVKGQDMDQGNNTAASGVGEINAASGATVWEDYQVGEWRGGTASSTIYNNKGSWKFFPFQSYSVQNIEAPVNYAYGSNCKCYWTIFGNGSVYDVNFPLIASSGSLFKLASGGTVRKWYDPTTDHVCFEMGGTAALDALTLSVMGETVTSSDYYLPIPANLKIVLKSGNNLTVSKPMTMHAGSVVEVKSGATLTVNNRVHLFDADDWDTYCMYAYYYRTYYSPSLHFNRGEGTAKTTLEDATVIVDGTVDVKGAYLYSSAHGSNICGNGGGTFKYAALPSNTTMTQCKVLKDNVSVNIRSANLHNDNDTYTKGIASTTFKNVNGRWFTNAKATEKANHTYDFTYIKSGDVYGTGGTNATVAACWSKDRTGLELQNKWANIQAEGCADWWKGIDDSHLYNWTRNSAWHQYIKTGSTTTGSGDEAVTTDIYAGSDGKLIYKTDCTIEEEGTIDANCLYTVDGVKKALVDGSFIAVTANATPDHGYHATADASAYYLCFDGCVWHPATRNAENRYTVDGTFYIWYNNAWLAVQYDSTVKLYYSLSATNVKIYYEYIDHVWTLAVPVAEVITSAGTEQVFSLTDAITKAKAGGTNVTIRLLKDMTVSSALTYDGTNNCGLDLNGYTLTGTVTSMITVNNASATLIIKDQSPEGNGKIQASFSRSDNKVYGLNVTKGHIILNGGTVHVENTHASQGACGVVIKTGHKFTINGGTLETTSKGESWGVYTESSTTSQVTVNGGTINTTTTSASAATGGIQSLGGIITISGGTISTGNATSTTVKSVNLTNANSTLTISGGTITTTAKGTDYGVYVTAGSTATITGGTITTTTVNATARGVISYGTTTISGGSISATAGTTDAKAIYVANNTTTINAGATVNATATSNAYGIYYSDGAAPVVVVNGGAFTVSTTSTTGAYGVYANKGTGTINDGTFTVTAKTTGAEGMHVESTNTPKLTLNGGKFMVKNSNGAADGTINNTAAATANFSLAGGYFNLAPAGSYIASGKSVKDVDSGKEPEIYAAGYTKKIAGNEYTVTWMNYNGTTLLGKTQVESGKVPVWTGETPTYNTSTTTREFDGWSTEKKNGGATYLDGAALPAVAADDVTYYAHYDIIYAEVIAGGSTTRYSGSANTAIQNAWNAAKAYTNATLRILSNYGTEADGGKCLQLVFNPTNANSTLTFDLNGHSWVHGSHGTASNNKDIFLHVNPAQANCKLIITDNSASGNGYLMNKQAYSANLLCANVTAGELLLQGGGLKVNNTHATCNAVGVQANGGVFNMVGGLVESKKEADAVTGGMASGVYAYSATNISGGTIRATNAKSSAAGVYVMRNTFTTYLSDDVHIETSGSQSYAVYGYGSVEVSGGTYDVTAEKVSPATWSTARGVYMCQNSSTYFGKATVKGNPVFNVTGVSGAAYGVYSYNHADVESVVEGGTFNISTTNAGSAVGATAQDQATTTVKGGTFNVSIPNASYEGCWGVQTQAGGIVNVEGGTFTMTPAKVGGNNDCVRCTGDDNSQLNISGGTFTSTNGAYCVRCFTGTTRISGNPVFSARNGIDLATWAVLSGDHTVTAIVDGGTFIATVGKAINSTTSTRTISDVASTVTGDLTIWDGKFYSASDQPVNSSCGTSYLKIRGGYYSTYTSSNVSNLTKYVVSPSTTEAYATTIDGRAYTYRVNTKYNVTWSVNGNTTVQEYNRNETPSYGSTPTISDGNTWEFLGWDREIVPVTEDVTYTAQFQKWEAEVTVPGETGSKKYASFVTAFNEAQNLPMATIKVLSNVYYSAALTLNPDSVGGSKPLTIDLNNHVVNYTPLTTAYALTVDKTGCKLIIDDSSVAKGGQIGHRQTPTSGMTINAILIQHGELELAGGTIIAQNNYAGGGTATRAIVAYNGTLFTQTGGKVYAKSRNDARALASGGTCTFNITGGTIEASCEYTDGGTKWGSSAYGVVLWNYGTFNMSGTATMNVHAGSSALGVYTYGASARADISGGSITTISETSSSKPVNANNSSVVNISGGDITATGKDGDGWSTEAVSCSGGIINITGGNFHSDHGANCNAVRVYEGTVTISGNPYFDSRNGIAVGDWATKESCTATVYVNGGTFVCPGYVLYSRQSTNKYSGDLDGTVTGTTYVNGGYFKSTGSNICNTSSQTGRLILNGGYYNERSGTTQKTNITTYKGATTEVTTLSPVVHDAYSNEYHYELLTDFNITWLGGDSYSKVTQAKSGTVPTNTELEGKSFLRNDSAFYFTGWTPTPAAVTGEATYNAEGVYHEAKVTVAAKDSIFDDFDEAWSYAMEQANATITLLTNLTRTTSIVYNPAPANARHTFDLNNFTIKENTTDRLLIVNKTGAHLTITDNSSAKGGCLYKKMNSSSNMSTTIIYHGEMILAGGKIYVENTKDDKAWHPAMAVHTSVSSDGIFTMTGGTVESQAKYLAYPIYNYATTNISGGTVIANATSGGAALGLYAIAGTATISGGTFNVTASTNATGAIATGWINNDGSITENGVLNITGGTFNVSPTTNNARAIQATGTGKNIGGTIYTAHGIANISGGTFNVACPPVAAATQIFGAVVDGWRLFDGALPHTMIGESRGEMNISGGTFTIDARDNGTWVANSGNVDMLRSWGTLNVSGGNFTLHQYSTPSAISVFRGKTTVSGNPVFNVYGHTGNAYAVCVGYWTSENYCDKDAANNLAEAEINGGTFKIITEGQNTNVIYSLGQISAESRDAVADTITAHAGYAMNAKITVNGGEFLGICPNASGKYPIMLNSRVDQVGTYGTAKSEIYVNGGKFKSRKGTEADNTTSGAVNCHNNVGTLLLTGGYYETNGQLAAQKADTCDIINITSADIDPEYANGYRYRIDVHYVAQVTATGVDRKFATLKGALDYAKTLANSTVTLLNDCNFETDGIYGYALGATGKTMTIDLNNHTVNATNSVTSYDRVFGASGQITVTDNSVAKGGKLNLTKNHNGTFIGIVLNDACQLTLANGTIYVENEMASKSATAINIWGTTGIFRQTGGTLQVKATSGLAEGIHMRGTANISGGNVIATSVSNNARAFAQDADAANSKYSSLTVSGTPTITVSGAGEVSGVYSNIANTSATISGGTWNISSTTSGAYGVRLSKASASASISGGTFNVTTTTTSAYCVYASTSASATVTGGTYNATATTMSAYGIYVSNGASGTVSGGTFTSRNGAGQNECFGAFATGTGTTLDITGGTFDVNSADNAGGNINVVRVQPGATVTISGGTFRSGATGGNALVSFGGVTTVSGTALFEAQTGAYVGSWYQGDGSSNVTATVNLNGGTFNVKGVAINATWGTQYKDGAYLASPFVNSIVNVNGGRYKTTGSAIVSKKADGADGGTAVLNIAGGYFNEKSSTTHRDQIAGFVADTCKITDITSADIDPEYANGYRYRIDVDYRVKVTHGAVEKKFLNLNEAFEYAKAQTNPTITLIGNANFMGPYSFNPTVANWRGTLDLNNFTITSLQSASFADRYFTLNRSDIKLTVTDNSVAKGGVWNMVGAGVGYTYTIGIVVGLGELELAGGKIYVENNNAAQSVTGINTWCSTINKAFYTQTGGTLEAKSAKSATALTIYGATTISGGEVKATTTSGATARAFTLGVHDGIIGALTISGNPTITVNTATSDAHAIYSSTNGATATVSGGTFNITSGTTNAFGVYLQTNPSTITISGGTFNITTSGSGCRGLYLESGNGTINVSGGTFNVTTATSGSESWYNIEGMRITYGTGTINCTGGTFNITNHSKTTSAVGARTFAGTVNLSGTVEMNATQCFRISDTYISEVTAYVNISGGTFNSVSSVIYAKNTEGTDGNAGKFTSSDFTVTGGQFKTTGANHIDGVTPTSALHLQGGYFNERSGTNSRNNLATYVSAPYEVMNLDTDDAEYIAGYRYTVANAPVAKVKVGSSVTYHPTVASAFTAANAATSASTITMLKDATATSYLHYTGSQNCTLDLNGHTISYDGTTTEHRLLRINHADITFTVTDYTVSKEGKLLFNTSKATTSYGVVVIAGNFQLDAGTIEMHASGGTAEGVTPYNSGTSVTINGGKVYVVTTNSKPGYGAHSKKGTTTINGGTIQVEAAGAGYGIYYSAGITTVTDGKFNISGSTAYATNLSAANANMIIQGGWYNTNTYLKPNTPYQVLSLAGQSPYLYEVAEAYTLTWNLDGGEEATAGTLAGYVKVGAALTAPTVTKTGYTFAGWTPAVAATMPAANTTYTATWTINSFDVTFNMQGHGAAIAKQTIDYNGLVTEPAAPTEANYVFGGWYKEAGCTNAWNFATDHVTAATTLYAKWTEAVASVTINGSTTYYETIGDAFTAANGSTSYAPTIKVLQDVSGIASSLIYSGSKNCTLDLNHHRITGTVTKLIDVNASGKTFTIDDSSAEKDGTISMIGSDNARLYALYITAGTVNLKHGKIYAKNEAVYNKTTAANVAATAVYVTDGQSFIMDDGTVESEAQYASYAIYAYDGTSKTKTITIEGGLVKGHTNLSAAAAGIYARNTKVTVNGGTIIGHAWTSTAYGVYVRAGSATLNGGRIEATNDTISNNGTKITYGIYARGPITIPAASTVNVYAKARTTTAAAVYVYATITGNTIAGGTFTAKAGTTTARGIHSEGDITISGGTFNVNAASPTGNTNAPCGIYAPRGTVTVEGNPTFNVTSGAARAHGAFAYGTIGDTGAESTKFSGTININGGTFNVTTTATTAYGAYAGLVNKTVEEAAGNVAGTHYMPGIISITDGTFNVTATTNTACGIVLAAQQSETVGGVTTDRIPTATITGGKFNVVSTGNSSKAYAMNTTATNTALRVEGGWYSTKKMDDGKNMETKYTADGKTCNYHVLPLEGESPYMWEVAEAYSLTWNLDGGTVTTAGTCAPVDATGTPSGYVKPGASITAPVIARDGYTFASWSPAVAATMPAANTTYTAQWAVASVTTNDVTTPYATMTDAWIAVNSATAASTLTMLQDISITGKMQYTNTQNCTLDLNGHTITSTTNVKSPLHIYDACTFTITDGSVDKSGKLSMTTTYSSDIIFGACAEKGNLVLEAGTIEVISGSQKTCGVTVYSPNSFTMNGGTIHVVTSNSQEGRGLYFNGSVTINDGTIHVEAAGDGYAMKRDGGTITVNGGKFNINGATTNINHTGSASGGVTIRGGWYNTNNRLNAFVTMPYHVFDLTGESPYRYEVAEGYTLTWATDGDPLTGTYTSGLTKVGATIVVPNTPTKTGYTFTAWTPAVAATMPAANTTYTATWESAIVGDKLDIVDWTATTLTLNTNGWTASGWPYTINGIEYAKDARAADRTLEIPYSGEAGEDLWITVQSGGSITNLNSYSIPFINTTAGTNASSIVYVNSGTLTISSNTSLAALYVRPEARVNITSGTLTVGKLVMRTLPWQAAAIDGEFVASEVWYTRIAPNKRTVTGPYAPITYESSSYYQFALPRNCTAKLKDVQVSHGANTPYGNTWLLKRYNEETRAANGTGEANWVVLDKEEYIQGGVGYEMSSNSNYYREFYFPLGAVNSASIGSTTAVSFHSGAAGAQHAGWNWVASPLMSVYDNSDANPETGMKIGWLLTDGSYDQGIPEYIYPAIPFTYQTSSGQSYISFEGSSIVAAVPQRRTAVEEEPVRLQWIHLDIQDTNGVGDHTSILAHPMRYEEAYKPGIDVAKQSFTASRALLYSSHAYGEMAFAGVSDSLLMRGVTLTIYSPVAQELTISMRANNWLDRLDHVWLVDYETGVRTDLLIGDYTFDAAAGTTAGRIVLEGQFKTPQIITGNEDVQDESTKPVKYIYEDKMYIQIGDKVYDATGKLVNKK